jgi:hypothetical protein
LDNNLQGETNFHNFIPTYSQFDPRQVLAIIMVFYGVVLPIVARVEGVGVFLEARRIVVPSILLSVGFLISAVLSWFDQPTGREEEYGELFLTITLVIIAVMEGSRLGWRVPTFGNRVRRLGKLLLRGLVLLMAVAAGWFVWSMGKVWVAPRFAARYLAEPAEVEWFDQGAISLVAYQSSYKGVIEPGDDLTVKLYWQTNQHIPASYWLSVHVLSQPDIASVASYDAPMGAWGGWRTWPTTTWEPGVTMRDVVHLQIPDDLPPGEDYWLVVRIWLPEWDGAPWGSGEAVLVTSTDRELFEPFSLILLDLRSAQ